MKNKKFKIGQMLYIPGVYPTEYGRDYFVTNSYIFNLRADDGEELQLWAFDTMNDPWDVPTTKFIIKEKSLNLYNFLPKEEIQIELRDWGEGWDIPNEFISSILELDDVSINVIEEGWKQINPVIEPIYGFYDVDEGLEYRQNPYGF